MQLADSHCHLNMLDLKRYNYDIHQCLAQARSQGVKYLLNVCVSMRDFPDVLSIAMEDPYIASSVGVHPDSKEEDPSLMELIQAASSTKVVALGETGLDYYHGIDDIAMQQERFRLHIRAAKEVNKPLIVHTRQAKDDTIRILESEDAAAVGGVLHCFTEDWDMAQQALDLGFYIALSGIVTFRNAYSLQEVAQQIPLDRLLVETDAPYLAPTPMRGKPNEPAYLVHTVEYLAKLRKISSVSLAAASTANYLRLFHNSDTI